MIHFPLVAWHLFVVPFLEPVEVQVGFHELAVFFIGHLFKQFERRNIGDQVSIGRQKLAIFDVA